MESVDLKLSMYIDFDKENDKESPKPKVGDHARIPKYNNLFSKDYVPIWSEEVFLIKKVMNTVLWTYVGAFKKSDKLCVTWKDYNNSFNSWIDKKGSINE